jgi:hypothetical protein
MFLLPSGPAMSEGQDRDHPIVLVGYKKDEFGCLLKVMYPTYVLNHVMFTLHSYTDHFFYLWTFDRATSLISGRNFELHLKKEEWVSVLKLSTIWNMTKVCRTQSLTTSRVGLTDNQHLLTRSGSTRFTSCRLIQCYHPSKKYFWQEHIKSVHG